MNLFFIFINLFTVIPSIYKFYRRRDIFIFDIILIANFLYLFLIPFYQTTIGNELAIDIVGKAKNIYIVSSVYQFIILIIDLIFSSNRQYVSSFANLSHLIRCTDKKIVFVNKGIVYFITITIFILFLFTITFANQDGKIMENSDAIAATLERNGASLFDKLFNKVSSFCSVFIVPTIIYTILIIRKSKEKWLKRWSVAILLQVIVILLLGPRTNLILTILFVAIYFYYSLEKRISIWKISLFSIFLILFISLFFPFYRGYRMVKNTGLLNNDGLSLIEVVEKAYEQYTTSEETREFLQRNTGERSMGVFKSVNDAVNSDVRFYGQVVVACITNILPGAVDIEDHLEIKLATTYNEKGTDIADCFLMYSIADWGEVGCFFCVFYILFYLFVYSMEYEIVKKNSRMPQMLHIYILYSCFYSYINPETSIYYFIKTQIYTFLPIVFVTALYFAYIKDSKKYYLS